MTSRDSSESALARRLLAACDQHPRVAAALALAARAHHGAVRDDGAPYLGHPLRTALILTDELGILDIGLVSAALLHDAIEDSPGISPVEIVGECGDDVALIVVCLTDENRDPNLPREERKRRYLERFAAADDACLLVKLCDRLDNLRSLAGLADPEKASRIRRQTRQYLMPLLKGRPGVFQRLRDLLKDELDRL